MSYTATSFNWTDLAVAELKTRWAAGETCTEIALNMGGCLTRNAVIGKVTRLGLKKRRDSHLYTPKPKRKRAERTIRRNGGGYVPVVVAPLLDEEPDTSSLEEIEASPPPATFLGIALLDLKPNHCRYPRGEGAAILFCGQPKRDDASYCTACHRRCHSGFHKMELSDAERARRRMQAIKNNQARRVA